MRLVTLLSVLAALTFGHASGADRAQPAESKVNYDLVEQWKIALDENVGFGRVVVIDPAQRSEEGLLALAGQLRQDTINDHEAVVYIYDDPIAAKMWKDAANERLTYAEMKLHDDHMLGIYSKIQRAGWPPVLLRMTLEGASGPQKVIALP